MTKLKKRGPVILRNAALCMFVTLIGATLWVMPRPAHAQSEAISSNAERYRSEKSWAMEFRMGPYRPDIDGESSFANLPEEQRPHQLYFGSKQRLLTQAEVDYQFFDKFGSLAIGVTAGYFREKAKAFIESTADSPQRVQSGDATSLLLLPTSLSLVYRFDVMAIRWGIPLVPYAKAGLDWVYWSASNGNGKIGNDGNGGNARGDATGYHTTVGLSLLLDVLDSGSAQEFDAETGVNHTYVFVEASHYALNGLGSKNQPRLGDTTWSAGFMFEF
jgi:hypothetical protein